MKLITLLITLAFLTSCGDQHKVFDFSGGKLSFGVTSILLKKNIDEIDQLNAQIAISQLYEGLISLDPSDLSPRAQLAESFDIKDDGMTYEFKIRKNVKFVHPNGETAPLTPKDVLYTFQKACTSISGKESRAYTYVFKNNLLGADEFFTKQTKEISGIQIKGNIVRLQLIRPDNNFLSRLALPVCNIQSQKFASNNTEYCGTGPFVLHSKNIKSNEIILTKNEHYYQKDKNGCQLPYLDTLEFVIIPSKLAILEDFESGRTQLITAIPTNKITQMLEGRLSDFNSQPPLFVLNNTAQFVSSYYVFNMLDKRLQDKRVRQAFNYALNREKLGQVVLRNQYFELGYYGVVPPIRNFFRGYDFDGVRSKGYVYNPEKAKKLLAEAGYPDGKGFGSIDIRFDVNDLNAAVADEIAQQFKNVLGINVVIDGSEYKQLSNDYDNGNGSIFRYTWTADYGSPESFLLNFYGKYVPASEKEMSPINIGRFKDAVFDKLLEKARDESNIAKQRQLFSDAEKHLIEQAPVIPLWYHGDIQISYSKVRNLLFNPLAQFTFKEVYLKEWTKEEYLDKMKK